MKILFLSAYFYPERFASSYLWENLREALSVNDFDMELYVPTPTRAISDKVRKEFKKRKYEEFLGGRLKVYRFPMVSESKNSIQRAFRYLLTNYRHYNLGIRAKNIDMIFVASTPPTQGWIAAKVKRKLNVPFVYCLQDIFPDSLVGTGLAKKKSLIWKIGRKIEDYTYKNADKIIVISEGFKENIMNKGVSEEKIEVIYNWVDEKVVVNIDRKNNILFDKYGLDKNKFYITYSGNIGLTQNMNMLINVASKLREHQNIHFVLIGDGVFKNNLVELINKYNLNNITLLPFQPYEDISYVFSLGDVGLIISKKNVGQNSVPSKTWNIMSAERPVLMSFDEGSSVKHIIKNNDLGVFVSADDEDALMSAILKLYEDKELRLRMGKNGRLYVENHLTKDVGISKYLNIFEEVIKKNNL
ncbi:Lipopolysaccharide biosynthesis protein [uncultured Paludibacter sp.]|nr:Lipopolysaccharide biosynthesis protein [uncultured Paludibacter sp.]